MNFRILDITGNSTEYTAGQGLFLLVPDAHQINTIFFKIDILFGILPLQYLYYSQVLNKTTSKMKMTQYTTALLVLLISLPQALFAGTDGFDIKHLQSLFENYKRAQSYEYAHQHQAEMEGDPYFDYFYGVSAIDTGHASEGTFALERVLLVFPQDQVARIELARGYFILQEYALARETFQAVLKDNPPPIVKDTAEAYLDRIRINESRYRPTHSGYMEFSLGADDNVNVGVDENLSLPDSEAKDDNYASISGGWTYIHPMSPGWLFESTLSGDFRKNQDLSEFDTATGTIQLGIAHLQAASKYKAEIIAQQFNLDGDSFRTLSGINLNWQYTLSQQSSFNSSLQYAQFDYPDLAFRNSDLITLGMNYTHAFSSYLQPLLFTTLSLGTESAEDSSNPISLREAERDIYSLRLGLVLNFTNTLALQTAIGTQNSDYSERDDDYNTADLNLIWAFARKWRLNTRYGYTKNDSTDNLRSYERNIINMTVNYTF